jgi:hypothetical protein
MAVSEAEHAAFEQFIATSPYQATKIGRMKTKGEKLVQIL